MKYILTLTNEQAIKLYNDMQNIDMKGDRSKNRNRWKFLEVIEDAVFAYEKELNEKVESLNEKRQEMSMAQSDTKIDLEQKKALQKTVSELQKKTEEELKEFQKVSQTFEFNDGNVYQQGKAIFKEGLGATDKPEELKGQPSKLIVKIEDAFLYAKEEDGKPKN